MNIQSNMVSTATGASPPWQPTREAACSPFRPESIVQSEYDEEAGQLSKRYLTQGSNENQLHYKKYVLLSLHTSIH